MITEFDRKLAGKSGLLSNPWAVTAGLAGLAGAALLSSTALSPLFALGGIVLAAVHVNSRTGDLRKVGGAASQTIATGAETDPKDDRFLRIGRSVPTGIEWVIGEREALEHMYVTGKSREGRRVFLLGMAHQAIEQGSGVVYVDGGGDAMPAASLWEQCRRFGREDDFLILDFRRRSDAGLEANKPHGATYNPFSSGQATDLTEMMLAFWDQTSNGAMWTGRAMAMLTAILRPLTWLRDEGKIQLNAGVVRDHMDIRTLIDMTEGEKYPGMPVSVSRGARSFLTSLPGFAQERGAKQARTTLDQFEYLALPFRHALSYLAENHEDVLIAPESEVDMTDILGNRRILVVLSDAADPGRLVVGDLKRRLANQAAGEVGVLPTDRLQARKPFLCLIDDASRYLECGLERIGAQATAAGTAIAYGETDVEAIQGDNLGFRVRSRRVFDIRPSDGEAAKFVSVTLDDGIVRTHECEPLPALETRTAPSLQEFVALRKACPAGRRDEFGED